MGIRSFLKDFSNVIDETLRQKSGPSRMDQSQRAMQELTSKVSLRTLLSSGVAPKGGRELLTFEIGKDIFEIGEDIHLFLAPTNIQINSPDRIEEALFDPFRTMRKQILIINAQNGKVIPATLHTIDDTFLIADTEHSTVLLKSGEPLVVVFPVLPQRHYVLQTVVEAVYPHRLKLQYKDPRYDRRWSMPPTIPVRLRLASAEVMLAMTRRQGHMVREMTMASDEAALRLESPHGSSDIAFSPKMLQRVRAGASNMYKSPPLFSSAQYAMIAHINDKDPTPREDDS